MIFFNILFSFLFFLLQRGNFILAYFLFRVSIMFLFKVFLCCFRPEISTPEMSSYSSSSFAGSASTCSDSDSTVSTTTSSSSPKKIRCYFDPSTCRRQSFSIPEKIVYYLTKNGTNGKTFQKLVETCKYFYKVNPVIVVPRIECHRHEWYACYGVEGENRVKFKYGQPKNYKIWITRKFVCFSGRASQMIPLIYKNDAIVVELQCEPFKLEDFIFIAANAKELTMFRQLIKYENGEIVQFEDIVKNLPKVQSLTFQQHYHGNDVNCNTVRKLMEIEHIKHLSKLILYNATEALNVEEMFDLILENQDVYVNLWYRHGISDAGKELVEEYSNRLENENGCKSRIGFNRADYFTFDELHPTSFEDDNSDTSFDSTDDDDFSSDSDEKEDFLFPWKNEEDEEWELPWDKNE